MAFLFAANSLKVHLLAAAAVIIAALAAIPFRKAKSGLFPITLFLLFTFAGNLFFHSGRIIYDNGILSITDEALQIAGVRTFRVFSMIFGAKILTALVAAETLLGCFQKILKPFERLGVPVEDFFSIMALTLKSFPVLMDYLSRNYREDTLKNNIKGFRRRARHLATFLMPLFVKSINSPESFFEDRKKTSI